MGERLQPGAAFPALTLKLTDGTALALPAALAGGYGVLLFFRGHW